MNETRIFLDVPYVQDGTLSPSARERCRVDLYLPVGADSFATLVWFHGGGLKEGSRAGASDVAFGRWLAGQGIGFAGAGYRLAPDARYPEYLYDAAAAVAWAAENIAGYGGDPDKIFVGGHSAGAYLAAMLAMQPGFLGDAGVSPGRVRGFIPVSAQMFTHWTVREERGIARPETTPTIDDAAPAHYARADAPDMLVLWADGDIPARPEENRYFLAILRAAGHDRAYGAEITGRDHGSIFDRLPDEGDQGGRLLLDFLRERSAAR